MSSTKSWASKAELEQCALDIVSAIPGAKVVMADGTVFASDANEDRITIMRHEDEHEAAINECPGQRGGLEDR